MIVTNLGEKSSDRRLDFVLALIRAILDPVLDLIQTTEEIERIIIVLVN
jgi:hypothetical protein